MKIETFFDIEVYKSLLEVNTCFTILLLEIEVITYTYSRWLLRFFKKSDHPTKGAVLITDQPHVVISFITDTTDQK